MAKELSYEASIAEVEKIIKEIEQGEISIDTLSQQVKKAMELIHLCKNKLQTTEAELQKLLQTDQD
ncbi:MAG TPA: exodeoxyribonuclease VII small subunit [Bacteroidales bacterium]|jgi:exodeoxyribonuclease VII small subunit|nr:exodeoxyribonuclease VII small subunit [Bacteroidales bacterium]